MLKRGLFCCTSNDFLVHAGVSPAIYFPYPLGTQASDMTLGRLTTTSLMALGAPHSP